MLMGDLRFCFSHVGLTCPFTSVFRVLRMLGDSVLMAPLVVVYPGAKLLLRLVLRLNLLSPPKEPGGMMSWTGSRRGGSRIRKIRGKK